MENVKALGVKIETNVVIGKSVTIDELMENEGFEAKEYSSHDTNYDYRMHMLKYANNYNQSICQHK